MLNKLQKNNPVWVSCSERTVCWTNCIQYQ